MTGNQAEVLTEVAAEFQAIQNFVNAQVAKGVQFASSAEQIALNAAIGKAATVNNSIEYATEAAKLYASSVASNAQESVRIEQQATQEALSKLSEQQALLLSEELTFLKLEIDRLRHEVEESLNTIFLASLGEINDLNDMTNLKLTSQKDEILAIATGRLDEIARNFAASEDVKAGVLEESLNPLSDIGKGLKEILPSMLPTGIVKLLDILGAEVQPWLKPLLSKIRQTGGLPDWLYSYLETLGEEQGEAIGAILTQMGTGTGMGILQGFLSPLFAYLNMPMARDLRPQRMGAGDVANLWLRRYPKGYSAEAWKKLDLKQKALAADDLGENIEAWFEDLDDLGWSKERQEGMKVLAQYMPSPQEVMTWAAREIFEPKLREKYQLDKFMPPEYLAWAEKVGISGEVAKNYWAAHWVLPSLSNIVDLWRRQIIDKETVDAYWTELDMVPWIREDLFKLFRAVPTRVDVRRFWDMGTIDEPRLRDIYKAMGYWEQDLEDYVTWTKVYVALPDLTAQFSKGWLTEADFKAQLTELCGAERAETLYKTKIAKTVKPERVVKERDLTMSDIVMWVKKDPSLRWQEGLNLLTRLGYDDGEAWFILDARISHEGSPETGTEWSNVVENWRKAVGLDYHEITQEAFEADRELLNRRKALQEAKDKGEASSRIAELEALVIEGDVTLDRILEQAREVEQQGSD